MKFCKPADKSGYVLRVMWRDFNSRFFLLRVTSNRFEAVFYDVVNTDDCGESRLHKRNYNRFQKWYFCVQILNVICHLCVCHVFSHIFVNLSVCFSLNFPLNLSVNKRPN